MDCIDSKHRPHNRRGEHRQNADRRSRTPRRFQNMRSSSEIRCHEPILGSISFEKLHTVTAPGRISCANGAPGDPNRAVDHKPPATEPPHIGRLGRVCVDRDVVYPDTLDVHLQRNRVPNDDGDRLLSRRHQILQKLYRRKSRCIGTASERYTRFVAILKVSISICGTTQLYLCPIVSRALFAYSKRPAIFCIHSVKSLLKTASRKLSELT